MIVITGRGVVSPFGTNLQEMTQAVLQGETAVMPAPALPCLKAASIQTIDLKKLVRSGLFRRLDAHSLTALAAVRIALKESGHRINTDPDQVGIILGSGSAGFSVSKRYIEQVIASGPELASPMLFTNTVLNAPASHIAIDLGLHGINLSCSRRYCSGIQSVFLACNALQSKKNKTMIAGGVDLLDATLISIRQLAVTGNSAFPYPGEGAYSLVLENRDAAESRSADIKAAIRNSTWESHSFQNGAVNRITLQIQETIAACDINPRDIRYVIASGDETTPSGRMELSGINATFKHAHTLISMASHIGQSDCTGTAQVCMASEIVSFTGDPVLVTHFDYDGNMICVLLVSTIC